MRSTPLHLPLVWGLGEGSRFASTTSEAGGMPNGPGFPEELWVGLNPNLAVSIPH